MKDLMGSRAVISEAYPIPSLSFVAFQAVFAIITVALISGAIADRARFGAWMVFAGVWATLVYFPVAHWVFAFNDVMSPQGGWIANNLKAIDFAGGTAVHINAGAAGLALAIAHAVRRGHARRRARRVGRRDEGVDREEPVRELACEGVVRRAGRAGRAERRGREVDVDLQQALVRGARLVHLRRVGGVGGREAADALPAAVEVVERVVLLVDHHQVLVATRQRASVALVSVLLVVPVPIM